MNQCPRYPEHGYWSAPYCRKCGTALYWTPDNIWQSVDNLKRDLAAADAPWDAEHDVPVNDWPAFDASEQVEVIEATEAF